MILDTLLEIYMKEGRDEPEAMGKIAEDAIRGRRIRKKEAESEFSQKDAEGGGG